MADAPRPGGEIPREIDVPGRYPTSLRLGGPDGEMVHVAETPGLARRRSRPD